MKSLTYYLLLLLSLSAAGCQEFLDEKPTLNLLVPETVDDLEKLLDATTRGLNDTPSILEIGTDNIYTTDAGYSGMSLVERSAYTWQKNVYESNAVDWDTPYQQILYANVVLDEADKLSIGSQEEQNHLNEVKGRALWMRAQAYAQLMNSFAAPFEPGGSNSSPGVPLHTSPEVKVKVKRATVGENYAQIIEDLELALELLPDHSHYKTRASKHSTHALLARVYLAMEEYELAGTHAETALGFDNALMDYNKLDLEAKYPFPLFNTEVIHHLELSRYLYLTSGLIFVDSTLVKQFEENDLRKELLFTPTAQGVNFDGNYSGSRIRFSGLANNEMYLITAECAARNGDVDKSLTLLNTLLETRWQAGTFVPFQSPDAQTALELILEERRKELIFRGIRWSDLRRLNRDSRFAKAIQRNVGGESIVLEANSTNYLLPIPPLEIQVSGIAQNPRK